MSEPEVHHHYDTDFLHHQHSPAYLYGREIVFGIQDGMVSALGALIGIAVGSNDQFTVLLAGFTMIIASALSMAIGTYNSIATEKRIEERMLEEERSEIEKCPEEEKREIERLFLKDGWSQEMARQMAGCACKDNALMLREMTYRELSIVPNAVFETKKKAVVMFFAWMLGGSVPLIPYFFLPFGRAVGVSMAFTLCGLFVLGGVMSRFTKQSVVRAGSEFVLLGGAAIVVGYLAGLFANAFIQR